MRAVIVLLVCTALCPAAKARADCVVRDFLTMPLPAGSDPAATAVEAAYPGSDVHAGVFATADNQTVPAEPKRDVGPAQRLDGATFGDMFVYRYPLTFDLTARGTAWNDPGRIRNDAFFRALYGETESEVRDTLVTVSFVGATVRTDFSVTSRNCVATQLGAALAEAAALSPGIDVYFEQSGGSFNWRVIAGTDRLSSHSFGAAIDLNSERGGYWRWSGRPEGDAGDFANQIPADLVAILERRGFIWGGKWHHFDGMHFEYRPELILHARLVGG
jgi:hypothetical protein